MFYANFIHTPTILKVDKNPNQLVTKIFKQIIMVGF